MTFTETPLPGAFLVESEPREDDRGWFVRLFATEEMAARGLDSHVEHMNLSFNRRAGTVRGMHYQAAPYGESKLVRCTAGAIFDVIVDLRPDSPTYGKWHGVELTARSLNALYIPKDVAHGFQTLRDESQVLYLMSTAYAPSHARGVRFDDHVLAIRWPQRVTNVSERDRAFPHFEP